MNRLVAEPVLSILALVRGADRYMIVYDADNKAEALKQLGRWASDRDLSFTWYDAARLSMELHKSEQPK